MKSPIKKKKKIEFYGIMLISQVKKKTPKHRADKPVRTGTMDISPVIFPFLYSLVHNQFLRDISWKPTNFCKK